MTDGRFKILSFRSKDPGVQDRSGRHSFRGDICKKAGITVVRTSFQHNDMRDTGPEEAKESIQEMVDKFIADDSPLRAVETRTPRPLMTDAGPVTPFAPVKPPATPAAPLQN